MSPTISRETLPEGSQVAMGGDLFSISVPGLSLIEAVGVLIALFVLIVTFRSFAVAWFPLVSALIGVGLAIALIYVSTAFASISSTTPLLALMLGLAVGIDYALFIVARHQDQVRAGVEPEESAARATGTAGSAVVFAGVTVLIALIGLGFADIPFLTIMGIAAAVAVAIAVLVAITLTPALLGFAKGRVVGWGHGGKRRGVALSRRSTTAPSAGPRTRIVRWRSLSDREPGSRRSLSDREPEAALAQRPGPGAGARSATGPGIARRGSRPGGARQEDAPVGALVTNHPVVTTVAVVLTLGVMAVPAASLALALPNAGSSPSTTRRVSRTTSPPSTSGRGSTARSS